MKNDFSFRNLLADDFESGVPLPDVSDRDSFGLRIYLCERKYPEELFACESHYEMAVQAVHVWKNAVRFGSCAVNIKRDFDGELIMDFVLLSYEKLSGEDIRRIYPNIDILYSGVDMQTAHEFINCQGIFRGQDEDFTILVPALYDAEIYAMWSPAYASSYGNFFVRQYLK